MKYFSKRFLTKYDVDLLKRMRRKYVTTKYLNHNENFIEFVQMDKAIGINDQEDEILQLIKEHLEPALKNPTVTWDFKWKNYDYDDLPSKLKSYIYQMDSLAYELWYQDKVRSIDECGYDRKLEKLEKMIPEYTDDQFIDHVLLGKPIPSSLGRKARESSRRSYKTVKEILKCNIGELTHFLTFTFAPEKNKDKHLELNRIRHPDEEDIQFTYVDALDFEKAKEAYSKTILELSRRLKNKGINFMYLTVWELQENGNYHFHTLCNFITDEEQYSVPKWLDTTHGMQVMGKGLRLWIYGKSDIQEIKSYAQMTTYISKYILKSFFLVNPETYETYLNKKKYFCSRGLKRPEIKYIEEKDMDVVLRQFDELSEAFVKEYENPYNEAKITNTIYTLIKEKNPSSEMDNELSLS